MDMVQFSNPPQFGTIKWIGTLPGQDEKYAGVETVSEFLNRVSVYWFLEIAFVWEVRVRARVCVCVVCPPQAMKNYSCEMKPEVLLLFSFLYNSTCYRYNR